MMVACVRVDKITLEFVMLCMINANDVQIYMPMDGCVCDLFNEEPVCSLLTWWYRANHAGVMTQDIVIMILNLDPPQTCTCSVYLL